MPALYSITTRASGTILTAAIYNADHQNHVTNGDAVHLGGYSGNTSQMQAVQTPGDVGSESLALSIADELARLRYVIRQMRGTDYWYRTPDATPSALNNGGRNKLHNSLFRMNQRGNGPWSATGPGAYGPDRWMAGVGGSDTYTHQIAAASDAIRTQLSDEEVSVIWLNNVTGTAAAGSFSVGLQRIEGVRRLAGKQVTLSFWWGSNVANAKIGISCDQNFGTGGSPSATVQGSNLVVFTNPANFQRDKVTFTVPSIQGKTLGTNGDDYTQIMFWFSSGATNNGRAGTGVQTAQFNIWGVQLEEGSVMTKLEKPDLGIDRSNCQRFYQTGGVQMFLYQAAGQTAAMNMMYPVTMRAVPTVTSNFTTQVNCSGSVVNAAGNSNYQHVTTVTALGIFNSSGTWTASADL